jgi:hypothetical protein
MLDCEFCKNTGAKKRMIPSLIPTSMLPRAGNRAHHVWEWSPKEYRIKQTRFGEDDGFGHLGKWWGVTAWGWPGGGCLGVAGWGVGGGGAWGWGWWGVAWVRGGGAGWGGGGAWGWGWWEVAWARGGGGWGVAWARGGTWGGLGVDRVYKINLIWFPPVQISIHYLTVYFCRKS